MRQAIMQGIYADHIQPGGQQMIRTYKSGREVHYDWCETDAETGSGIWLIGEAR